MNFIKGDAIVSCFVDAASFLLMVLLIYTVSTHQKKTQALRLYYILSWTIAVTCVVCFVVNALSGHTEPWAHTMTVIFMTFWELCALACTALWLAYVDRKLYDRWTVFRVIQVMPLLICGILLVINLFTGIVFTISEDCQLQRKPLYEIIMAVMLLLFISTSVAVWLYDRRSGKVRLLRVSPMIVSVFFWILFQFVTPYSLGVAGFAIGAALLYFSIASENRFMDTESGLYNKSFLTHIYNRAQAGKYDVQSALILDAAGNRRAGIEILRRILHQSRDVIRMDDDTFLMLTGSNSQAEVQLLSTQVEEAVARHNQEDPGEPVQISLRNRTRVRNEDLLSFIHSITEEKDAGDPVRGVVSMISELDRLDQELALAADIQTNVLPMIFPPFPDRTEFDIYASMTPAREIGGDFYDFFLIDSDHLGLVIADVSGKGIPSALFMMVSKSMIKNHLMSGCDPAEAMSRVNLQLCEHNPSKMFVTVWVAVVEISTGKTLVCNAGHEHPVIRRSGGAFELLKYKHGLFAGVSKKANYQNREFEFRPGDCIFVYTDGVPEATNTANEMFGEERLAATLNLDPELDPKGLILQMQDAVAAFAGGAEQFDDITMLCLKYFGPQAQETQSAD